MIVRYNMLNLLHVFNKKEDIIKHLVKKVTKEGIKQKEDFKAQLAFLPSFLLEEEQFVLFQKRGATLEERIVYLYLAGKRDFLDYKLRNIDSIPIEFSDLDIGKLKLNRLLNIENNIIYFKKYPQRRGI